MVLAIGLTFGACTLPDPNPHCNTCDGNVAIQCEQHNCDYVNPKRVDCGPYTCKVRTGEEESCTSQGSEFHTTPSYAECS